MANPRNRVPPRARDYIVAHPHQPRAEIARALGVTLDTAQTYCNWLIREGAITPKPRGVDLDAVAEAVADRGLLLREAARATGHTPTAVRSALHREGLWADDIRGDHAYTLAAVLRILGLTSDGAKTYRRARAMGLKVRTVKGRNRNRYMVQALDLMDFLERPDCPIDPARITDADWRAYALDARAGHLKPVRPLVVNERPGVAPCAGGCGGTASKEGGMCRSCAMRGNRRRKEAA